MLNIFSSYFNISLLLGSIYFNSKDLYIYIYIYIFQSKICGEEKNKRNG